MVLDTKEERFIIGFSDAVYRENRLYAIGSKVPEIVVYDSAGGYLKKKEHPYRIVIEDRRTIPLVIDHKEVVCSA